MLRKFVSRKHWLLYFTFIMITWLQALITPSLVASIVSSFEEKRLDKLWFALVLGIVGNLIILIGLAGKRYYYARVVADFTLTMKARLFKHFLYEDTLGKTDILSGLENDVKQLENTYLEPAVIIISSLGFTSVSIIYALVTDFWLGLVFIFFYAIPALCSGIGSQKLDRIAEEKAKANQDYLAQVTTIIGGERVIKNNKSRSFFFNHFLQHLTIRVDQDIQFEKQRTINTVIINSIDAFCSVVPIIIGGLMTYYNYLSGASFVAIYLVSHNIGYQFNELSYFINTYKSSQQLRDKYGFLRNQIESDPTQQTRPKLFPIRFDHVSLAFGDKIICEDLTFSIEEGEKVALIGPSGCGKSSLLNMIYGYTIPNEGKISYANQTLSSKDLTSAITYILQEAYVFDGLSLEDNITLGQALNKAKITEILTCVNLSHLTGKTLYHHQLSGGEKQRLEIARSLYHDSQLILADEVKSNLDKANAKQIENILMDLPQTLVEVIHHYDDQTLARYDKVIDLG